MLVHRSRKARPLLAYGERADCSRPDNMCYSMKDQFGVIRRPWGVFYLKNKITGEQTSLKTKDPAEARRLCQAQNDSVNQPQFNLVLSENSLLAYGAGVASTASRASNERDLLGRIGL